MFETSKALLSLARSLWRFAVTERAENRDLARRRYRCSDCEIWAPISSCPIHREMAETLVQDGAEAYWDLADLEDWSRRPADVRAIAEAFGVGPHDLGERDREEGDR